MNKQKVVIYCRVSSNRQVREGNGLESQEAKCRNWCKNKGYEVIKVFKEAGVSGGKKDRPAFKEMVDFLSEINEHYIVLVEDLNRWSRETVNHFLLKKQITQMGHSLQSVNMTLDDTEESELMETLSASVSQYERKKNAKRAKSCMIEHAKQGYWLFRPPLGYKHQRKNGKVYNVRLEPTATHIKMALEGFANGRFLTQKDVLNFLLSKDLISPYGEGKAPMSFNIVKSILSSKIYTGIFAFPRWNIPEQKWAVEPIISLETYQKIQDRLHSKGSSIKHRKYNVNDEEFPLRRWVKCPVCGRPLTGSKSKSKSGKYHPYYHCYYSKCSLRGKTIRPSELHKDFENLLTQITPNESLLNLAQALIDEKCKSVSKDWQERKIKAHRELESLKQEKEECFSLLLKQSNNPSVSEMCNTRMIRLDARIKELENISQEDETKQMENLKTHSKYVLNFLRKPLAIWKIGDRQQRLGVLKLCFTEPISYNKAQKFGTPNLSPIFGLFHHFDSNTSKKCA